MARGKCFVENYAFQIYLPEMTKALYLIVLSMLPVYRLNISFEAINN